jgi:hypothetical protein
MKTLPRMALEVLLPPFVVAVILTISYAVTHSAKEAMVNLVWIFTASFAVGIVPSIVYMIGVESAFALGLDPAKKRCVALSAFLGAVVGCLFTAVLGENELWRRAEIGDFSFFAGLGSLAGIAVAVAIRVLAIRRTKNAEPRPPFLT